MASDGEEPAGERVASLLVLRLGGAAANKDALRALARMACTSKHLCAAAREQFASRRVQQEADKASRSRAVASYLASSLSHIHAQFTHTKCAPGCALCSEAPDEYRCGRTLDEARWE